MTSSVRKKSSSSIKELLQLPAIVVFSFAPFALTVPDFIDYMYDAKARSWPTVNALITKFEAPISVSLKDPYFDCQIEYKYTVNDREYSSARLSYSKRSPQLGYDMGRFEELHKPGVEVPVHVDPANPANAVMEPVEAPVIVFSHFMAVAVFFSIVYFAVYPVIEEFGSVEPEAGKTDDTVAGGDSAQDSPARDAP